jgi:four helix bundle protein
MSIPLNIAEGNGRWHKNDKKRFLWIARGSVFEIVPIIRVIFETGSIPESVYSEMYGELDLMAKMLTALIKSIDGLQVGRDGKE